MTRWWWLATGCGGSDVGDVTFTPAVIPGSGVVTWDGAELAGTARLEYGTSPEALDQVSREADAASGRLELRGLAMGARYTAELVVTDGDKESRSEPFDLDVGAPPTTVPSFVVQTWEPDKSCMDGGYVLFSYLGDKKSGVAIIDREAQYVWGVDSPYPNQVGRVRPGRDGQSILWNIADEEKTTDLGEIIRMSYDGATETRTRTLNGHHDFVELPDGRMGWLSYERQVIDALPADVEGSVASQADPVTGEACVAVDAIYEGPEGLTDAEAPDVVWSGWDPEDYAPGVYRLIDDADSFLNLTCEGTDLLALELGHGNSLAYVDADDEYTMGWRWLDEIIRVSGDGETQWIWGGPFNELDGDAETIHQHSHFTDVWSGGMLIFDNRIGADSRLKEYSVTDSSYAVDWVYQTSRNEQILGDVVRMPIEGCDNVLVSYSFQGRIVELTRDGEEVWSIAASQGNVTARVYFLPDLYDFSGVAYRP